MQRFLHLLLFLLPVTSLGQVFNYSYQEVNVPEPAFVQSYIRNNKIRTITINNSEKNPAGRIRESGMTKIYNFRTDGLLEKVTSITTIPGYFPDTAELYIYYNSKLQQTIHRTFDKRGITTLYFDYNSEGLLSKKTLVKELNEGMSREQFRVGKQEVLDVESYEYIQSSPTQIKKIFLNDVNKPFREGIIYSDDKKRVLEEDLRFNFTGSRVQNKWTYDSNGAVIETEYFTNVVGDVSEVRSYQISAENNPQRMSFSLNGVTKTETHFFYDTTGKILEATITKILENEDLKLQKLVYTFY